MEALRSVFAACLIVGLSVVIGLHLALFWTTGGYLLIGEPNTVARVIESAMVAVIFLFGIERFVTAIRARPRARKARRDLEKELREQQKQKASFQESASSHFTVRQTWGIACLAVLSGTLATLGILSAFGVEWWLA